MRLRSLLRAAGRVPRGDERKLRDLMRDVARLPQMDDVLPARLCQSLMGAYKQLQPQGKLGFLSILSRQDVDDELVRQRCEVLLAAGRDGRSAGTLVRARADMREALRPASQLIIERIAQQQDGLRFLVTLRADLLAAMAGRNPPASQPPNNAKIAPASATSSAVPTSATLGRDPLPSPSTVGEEEDNDGERERWRSLDASLRQLLGVWFDAGLLRLERLTWEATPAALLGRLMTYERVHPFNGDWSDLRQRMDGPGRRLFAFLHPRMPGEPLVFVHVALCDAVPRALHKVLASSPKPTSGSDNAPDDCTTATRSADVGGDRDSSAVLKWGDQQAARPPVAAFYSISSPFDGLRGVPMGGLLIKHVLYTLLAESPHLQTFVTLSPVPGFRGWLEARLARHAAQAQVDVEEALALDTLRNALFAAGLDLASLFTERSAVHAPLRSDLGADLTITSPAVATESPENQLEAVRRSLLVLCARYLCLAAHRQRALDPVAAFHLRNGAELLNLNWGANTSTRGLRESAGIMVNYNYKPAEIEANHSAYVSHGTIAAAPHVWDLIRPVNTTCGR